MGSYINLPTLALDFIKPQKMAFRVPGSGIDGGRNGDGDSPAIDFSGGGKVAGSYQNCVVQTPEEHEYVNWLAAYLDGSIRCINVPILTDWTGPFPFLSRTTPQPIISGIPHSTWAVGQIKDGDFTGAYDPADVSVSRASTATYFDAAGVLQTAAVNTPRITAKGLMVEDAATNLLQRSQEFDNAYWIKANSSIVADAAVAPDGTMTMDKLVDSTGNSAHGCVRSFSYLLGETYTLSVYAKAGEYSKLRINAPFDSGLGLANFDLAAKTASVLNGAGAIARIEDVGAGALRCSLTITATNTNTQNVGFYLINNAGNISFAGTGSSGLYIWGAQLEPGLKATSYISTSGATATRAAETVTLAGSGVADWTLTQDDGSELSFPRVNGTLVFSLAQTPRGFVKAWRSRQTTPAGGPEALFSDGSGYSQATVFGTFENDAAQNAGQIVVNIFGATRNLRWSDWMSTFHATRGWRAWRYWKSSDPVEVTRTVEGATYTGQQYTLAISPPLREPVPVGQRIELARPMFAARFPRDFVLDWEVEGFWKSRPTLQFVEAEIR